MLFNNTHKSKENERLIDDIVGKSYGIIKSIQLKGTGSKRMIIDEVSPNMSSVLNKTGDLNYGNIELRPNGILIHITSGHNNFTWAIPLYQLVIYKVNGSSIHAQGKFVHFRDNKMFKDNKSFFDRLLDIKVKYDQNYNFSHIG